MDAGILGVEGIFHSETPMTVRTMPAMGAKGMMGQRMMRMRQRMPPVIIIMVPVMSRVRREKKPTMRETRRSMNMWNLRSREDSALAVSAEIWRKG